MLKVREELGIEIQDAECRNKLTGVIGIRHECDPYGRQIAVEHSQFTGPPLCTAIVRTVLVA